MSPDISGVEVMADQSDPFWPQKKKIIDYWGGSGSRQISKQQIFDVSELEIPLANIKLTYLQELHDAFMSMDQNLFSIRADFKVSV